MNNKKLFLSILCLLFLLSGCAGPSSQVQVSPALSAIPENEGLSEQLHIYDSPYTACFRNPGGGCSLFVFASPVQYKSSGKFEWIDNHVVESQQEGYAYENKANRIKTYFPASLHKNFKIQSPDQDMEISFQIEQDFSQAEKRGYQNLYGDMVEAVVYSNASAHLAFYPHKSGIRAELTLTERPEEDELHFTISMPDAAAGCSKGREYLLFRDEDSNVRGVFYAPIIQASNGILTVSQADIRVQETEDFCYQITVPLDCAEAAQYPIKWDISFEHYLNKMPDSTAYENKASAYLSSYSAVGVHPHWGAGEHFLRMRIRYFMDTHADNVISAQYRVKSLSREGPSDYQLVEPAEQWSSQRLSWRAVNEGDLVAEAAAEPSYFRFDITDFVKACLRDQGSFTESRGVILKSASPSGYRYFATSDHALYPPYIRIDLKEEPWYFTVRENINPPEF